MNIGDAARHSGVSAKMIRYYERIALITPADRSGSGYRTYAPADVHTLQFIHRARSLGFPLDAVRRLLALWQDRSRASREVKRIALETADTLRRKRMEIDAMVHSLEHLAANCRGDERPDCPIIDDMADHVRKQSAAPRSRS